MKLAVGEKKFNASGSYGLRKAPQLVSCALPLVHGRPHLAGEVAQAIGADGLSYRLLRFEEAVNIGLREADFARQVGHRGLAVAVMGKIPVGCLYDLVADCVFRRTALGRECGVGFLCHSLTLAPSMMA